MSDERIVAAVFDGRSYHGGPKYVDHHLPLASRNNVLCPPWGMASYLAL